MNRSNMVSLIFLIVAAVAIIYTFNSGQETSSNTVEKVLVSTQGRPSVALDLQSSGWTFFPGLQKGLTVEILNSAVRIKESSCSDKDCVNSGFLRGSGSMIVCSSNGITVELKTILKN